MNKCCPWCGKGIEHDDYDTWLQNKPVYVKTPPKDVSPKNNLNSSNALRTVEKSKYLFWLSVLKLALNDGNIKLSKQLLKGLKEEIQKDF